ncbi:nitroreductase family protein [Tumebacillus sp. DT12]|uniref:Nitroreductase family protein n=1 Tax=Tumebacillus lacus TaxID=2995335 RepID=A0ABT3X100_9BACL|nr:nitroreductase family protein [Tumebacillus lacus]MCX7569230.1 nitroreductase family protein [Tumebacillus lacus]
MELFEAFTARHTVRKYDSSAPVPAEDLHDILTAAATAPSAWNLQHWRFLVITDPARKQELLPLTYNQQQTVDAPVFILVLGDREADKMADDLYLPLVDKGLMPKQAAETLIGNIKGAYNPDNKAWAQDEAVLNSGFAAMQLMLAAKAKGYDTCPMGGIDRNGLRKLLNIPERFHIVMGLTLGKAAAPAHPTGRLPIEELVIKESF